VNGQQNARTCPARRDGCVYPGAQAVSVDHLVVARLEDAADPSYRLAMPDQGPIWDYHVMYQTLDAHGGSWGTRYVYGEHRIRVQRARDLGYMGGDPSSRPS
jgi:hypothetical protein